MTEPSAAERADRYHPQSNIHQYLVAKAANADTTALVTPATHDRWSVKTAADTDAQAMTGQAPVTATIAELIALPIPAFLPPDGRSDGPEKTMYQLTATLQEFGREADGDYHMVMADDQGNTMIAEIPNPGDVTTPSHFATQIANARTAFDSNFSISEDISAPTDPAAAAALASAGATGFRNVGVAVTLTGLGYFDFKHGQRGVAPNAIELHPVISIVFNGAPATGGGAAPAAGGGAPA
jgi:hypothetical protein